MVNQFGKMIGRELEKIITLVFTPYSDDHETDLNQHLQKEVERKRRENINDGITALKELIPSSESDEKKNSANKGAILTSAADYIRLLKNSEITNIEKWTYEKLLNDKALLESRGEAREYKRMFEVVETENQNLKGENQMLKETIRMLGGEDELDDDDEEEQDMLHANKRYRAA